VAFVVWAYGAGRVLVLSTPVSDPDAIVSLASHEWERLPAAADLAARYPHAQVLLTEPTAVTVYNCHDCANRVAWLTRAGVTPDRVHVLPLAADGTRAEADACRALASHTSLKRLLVVTSPYHTRRTLAVFRAALAGTGVEVGVEPATRYSPARPALWFTAPYDRWYVAYEWSALVYYAARYGIWPALDVSGEPV
jgi:uncharacterized SAM-binding protein YcdF (DUF218 family)